MSTINKSLLGFIYNGSALVLASAGWKGNVNVIYGFNPGGTGYTSFKPSSNFNSLTQLSQDGVYIVDAKTPGFDIPGATLSVVGGAASGGYASGVAGTGQSNLSGLARQRDRSGAQLGPFPLVLIHNDDANAEQPLQLGVNEAGLNGGLTQAEPRTDGAAIVGLLVNYYDGYGAERRFAERWQAAKTEPVYYFKKNVEHPANTNGATMATLTTQFVDYAAEFNRQRANVFATTGKMLVVTHLLVNQGEAEVGNSNFIADRVAWIQLYKTLFANPDLKILQVRTRGASNQYSAVGEQQVAWAVQDTSVTMFDDPTATYLSDGVHKDADSMDREGDAFADFKLGLTPTVTSFSPTTAAVGATITVTGTNLSSAGVLRIGGAIATQVTYNGTTQAVATVPAGAGNGNLSYTQGYVSVVRGGYSVGGSTQAGAVAFTSAADVVYAAGSDTYATSSTDGNWGHTVMGTEKLAAGQVGIISMPFDGSHGLVVLGLHTSPASFSNYQIAAGFYFEPKTGGGFGLRTVVGNLVSSSFAIDPLVTGVRYGVQRDQTNGLGLVSNSGSGWQYVANLGISYAGDMWAGLSLHGDATAAATGIRKTW